MFRLPAKLLSAVLFLTLLAPAAHAADWLVEVNQPGDAPHLQALADRGLMVVYRRADLVLGLASEANARALADEVRPLGRADDGRHQYLLTPHWPGIDLPAGVEEWARYGDERLVSIPPGTIERLAGPWRPVRIFHRPLRLTRPAVSLPGDLAADPTIQSIVDALTKAEYQAIHQDIVNNDGYPEREFNSTGGANAQTKIKNLFLSYGFTDVTEFAVSGSPTDNVVCKLPGVTTPNVQYVVGAHYDTTCFFCNSKGADDNGSGTAGVLAAAKAIGQAYQSGVRFDSTIVFITFAAEEVGLWGSDAYASWASNQGHDIRGMLNMDMIGYLESGDAVDLDTVSNSDPDSQALQNLAPQIAADYVPSHSVVESNGTSVKNQSDHYSFWQQGYPALFCIEDGFDYSPYIHSSQDVIGLGFNDYDLATNNAKVVLGLLASLAGPAAPAPTADFSGSPLSGQAPLSVDFSDLSTGSISSWDWTFGDGGTSSSQNPTHVYGTPGSYDVCLTVTGPGGSDQECKTSYVSVSGPGAPVAEFSAAPQSGPVPLSVNFTDLSTGTVASWSWTFGDGGTSTSQNPSHVYNSVGTYDVCLTATGPGGSDQECKPAYIDVTGAGTTLPFEIITAAGPGGANLPVVKMFNASTVEQASFTAFATTGWGADAASGSFDADAGGEHLAGPGPNPVFGPHVRGFEALGAPVSKVSLFAYGTLRFGVNVALGDLDGDGMDELGTGAGPGSVFGPHVRGFNYDGTSVSALPGLTFFAYQTLKYGTNLALASIDPDAGVEILTGPGPGGVFGAQIRGFDYAGSVSGISKVNFLAFAGYLYGATVEGGDLDGDGMREILVGAGPNAGYQGRVAGFDYDGASVASLFDHVASSGAYGAQVAAGDYDADAAHELLTAQGPDPGAAAEVRAWNFDAGNLSAIPALTFQPYGTQTHGARLAGYDVGIY